MDLFLPSTECVRAMRITNETPPRSSVLDVISAVTKQPQKQCSMVFARLKRRHPDLAAVVGQWKFPGKAQKETPVTDTNGIAKIIMYLPGRGAADVRVHLAKRIGERTGGTEALLNAMLRNRCVVPIFPQKHPAPAIMQPVEPVSRSTPVAPHPSSPAQPEALTCLKNYAEGLRRVRDIMDISQEPEQKRMRRMLDVLCGPYAEPSDQPTPVKPFSSLLTK